MYFVKKSILFVLATIIFFPSFSQTLKIYDLTSEYKNNPVGIDITNPRLAWKITSDVRNVMQTAYQIKVGMNNEDLSNDSKLVWNSGKVESDQSVHIIYNGKKLESKKRYYWQVKIWDNHGNSSDWSQPAFWEMGLL